VLCKDKNQEDADHFLISLLSYFRKISRKKEKYLYKQGYDNFAIKKYLDNNDHIIVSPFNTSIIYLMIFELSFHVKSNIPNFWASDN